jgi:hypothetical protein
VLTFLRPGARGAPDVLVLLNFGRSAMEVVPADELTRGVFGRNRQRVDLLTGKRIATRAGISIPARSALVLSSGSD